MKGKTNLKFFSIFLSALIVFTSISIIASAEKRGGIVISEVIRERKAEIEKEKEVEGAYPQEYIQESVIETPGERIQERERIKATEIVRIQVVPSNIANITKNCKDVCGDGICQRFVCLAIGCPCPETEDSCPSDCSIENVKTENRPEAFCRRYGYKYIRKKTEGKEIGYCIMPNGEICEELDFYQGECGKKYKNAIAIDLGEEAIKIDPEMGVKSEEKKVEVVGATPIFTARIRSIATENMNKEAIRITCRERIRIRDCENLSEEECEQLLKERFEKECLEKLPPQIIVEQVPIRIDIDNDTKVISIQMENLTVRTRNKLQFKMNQLFIETPQKNISINVIPSVATQVIMTKEPIDEIKNAELEVENDKNATYKIEGNRKARLLGLIPIELKIRARVSAETGDILSVEKPWWSFLTIR